MPEIEASCELCEETYSFSREEWERNNWRVTCECGGKVRVESPDNIA